MKLKEEYELKKKMVIGTLSAALVFGGALAVGASNNDDVGKDSKTNNVKTFLSLDEVKKIALQEVNGVVEDIELEKESNKAIYEVDIEKDDIDYDLYIDAYSGEIYSVDRDDHNDVDDDNLSNNKQNNKSTISQADATAIAEKAVNGKVIEIEKDEDDGLIKYEVELKTDRGEAEVEIDASTGKVLDVEWDD
jgi:uncharacterized membrane protein YkoI